MSICFGIRESIGKNCTILENFRKQNKNETNKVQECSYKVLLPLDPSSIIPSAWSPNPSDNELVPEFPSNS